MKFCSNEGTDKEGIRSLKIGVGAYGKIPVKLGMSRSLNSTESSHQPFHLFL